MNLFLLFTWFILPYNGIAECLHVDDPIMHISNGSYTVEYRIHNEKMHICKIVFLHPSMSITIPSRINDLEVDTVDQIVVENTDEESPLFNFYPRIELIIEEGITSIGSVSGAMVDELTVPLSLCNISSEFYLSQSPEITISQDHAYFKYIDGFLIENRTDTALFYNSWKHGKSIVTVPEDVLYLGDELFTACFEIQTVHLPETLIGIGKRCFSECIGLTQITIPDSVQYIDDSAFNACSNLQTVHFSSSLRTIGENAFTGCDSLMSVELPEGLRVINRYAFAQWPESDSTLYLHSVILPESLEEIQEYAFYGNNLNSVTIPRNVKNIGINAFGKNNNLTHLIFSEDVVDAFDIALLGIEIEQCSSDH